jgi:hypothetical protein
VTAGLFAAVAGEALAAEPDARLGPVDAGESDFVFQRRTWAVDVPADGRMVMAWAREGNWPRLVPWGLAPWCRNDFLNLLMDPVGRVDLTVCHRISVEIAPDIYGVPWWTAGRLAASATEHWNAYASWCVKHAFNPAGEPAHRVAASVLAWLRAGVHEEKDSQKLERALFAPPRPSRKTRASVPGFTPADQAAAFKAAMAQLGDGGG